MARTLKETSPEPQDPEEKALSRALGRLDALVDWERRERSGGAGRLMRVDLGPARDLAERLGNPQRGFTAVHVAGTKGKGSVASLVAAGAQAHGWRTGVYASPHVERVHERIRIDGSAIEDGPFASALERVLDVRELALREGSAAGAATWFDVMTLAAFCAFEAARVRFAVVECGLGGRLDSTNVLPSTLCVITNIGLEHTAILGSTREAIAAEKAGILKAGSLLVHGLESSEDPARRVLEERAQSLSVTVRAVTGTEHGPIEERNLRLAQVVLDEMGGYFGEPGLDRSCLAAPARIAARLPGRLERRYLGDVPVVLDGAHVPDSLESVLTELAADPELNARPIVVFGVGREKLAAELLKVLSSRVDRVLTTTVGAGPYRSPDELARMGRELGLDAEPVPDAREALQLAQRAAKNGWVLVTGSLHLVGALRSATATNPPC